MIQPKVDTLFFFLERKKLIFARWKEKIKIPVNQPLRADIEKSGELLFNAFLHALSLPALERESYIQSNVKDIVNMNQLTNTSCFVYNVNTAKTELLEELAYYHTNRKVLQQITMDIGRFFDQFLFHALNHYENTYEHLNEEKKQYIFEGHEERLTLLGQMTSSFVHEIKNPLTAIDGFIQLLQSENTELPYLDIIANEIDQLKFRISQFLMLSKRELIEQETSIFTFNDLLEQINTFIYPRLLEVNVKLQLDLEDGLYVKGSIDEIKQVMINIIFNALEVMAVQETNPVIHIKGYQENDSIILETSNTGPEIPDHLLQSIFEPFVTTKKTGTGLGLYVSKKMIEKHGGKLDCQSDDKWTTFSISLPAVRP